MSDHNETPNAPDDLGFELPPPTKVSRGRGVLIASVTGGALLLLFLAGLAPKLMNRHALENESRGEAGAALRVEAVKPKEITSDRALTLPGTVQPLEETVIYPRVSGYVKRWLVDLGGDVKEGDLLLEIDTPDLDAQLEQGRARLAEAEAGVIRAESAVRFSKSRADRYQQLTPAGLTSQQDLEQQQGQADVDAAGVNVAKANVAAAQANLRQLQQTKAFARVVAPFSGRIVQRWVERGMLVSAGTSNPLFRVQNTDPVRIFVNVPQDVAPGVRTGVEAVVTVREYPDRDFKGQVARSAGSLDDATRTMSTEVRVPNENHDLLAGMYVQVALTLPIPHRLYEIPATALYNDSNGTRVAVVGAGELVTLRKVTIERDTGTSLQISSGLNGDERVVRIANAALSDGSKVELIQPPPPAAAPAK